MNILRSHGSDARSDGLLDDLGADPVHVRVDRARGDDKLLAGDRVGCDAGHHAGRDTIHAVWVARLANPHDAVAYSQDGTLYIYTYTYIAIYIYVDQVSADVCVLGVMPSMQSGLPRLSNPHDAVAYVQDGTLYIYTYIYTDLDLCRSRLWQCL